MNAWWWLAAAVALVGLALVLRVLRLIRRDAFDTRMTFARVLDGVLASLHLMEGVAIDLRAHANNFSKAREEKPKRVQWVCPCCTYQFSVPAHDGAELVVFEWSVGKDSQWAVFIVSGGVKEEIHRIRENGCDASPWHRSQVLPAIDPAQVTSDARLIQVFEALGFRPHQPTWSYALWTIRSAATWIAEHQRCKDDA